MSKAPMLMLSLAMAAGSAAVNYAGQRKMAGQQDDANATWLAYQKKAADLARGEEEKLRTKAQGEVGDLIDANSQENREEAIEMGTAENEQRFTDTVETPDYMADGRVSGQEEGRSGEFDTALAGELSRATDSVRDRIKSLAKASAYGQSGMGGMVGDAERDVFGNINQVNQSRKGNADVLNANKRVQPEQFRYKQSPVVPLLSLGSAVTGLGAAGALGGAGGTMGQGLASALPGSHVPAGAASGAFLNPTASASPMNANRLFSWLG